MNEEELERLFKKHMKLARITLFKVFPKPRVTAKRKGLDLEDMYQYAYTGLWKACITYDPTKGTSFRTHAINHIRWHLIEKAKREGNQLKFNANEDINFEDMPLIRSFDKCIRTGMSNGNEEASTLHDLVASGALTEGEVVDELFVAELLVSATEEEIDIINLRMKELTYNEIADLRYGGCTGENVRAKVRNLKAVIKRQVQRERQALV